MSGRNALKVHNSRSGPSFRGPQESAALSWFIGLHARSGTAKSLKSISTVASVLGESR